MDKITPMKGMSQGVHMILKPDKETISIHLGPSWYIENQDIKIDPKPLFSESDTIEVLFSVKLEKPVRRRNTHSLAA